MPLWFYYCVGGYDWTGVVKDNKQQQQGPISPIQEQQQQHPRTRTQQEQTNKQQTTQTTN
jgi:hypothetical protein